MSLAELLVSAITSEPGPRPRDDELDLFGLTHPGKVRKENQDHFLICTVHQQLAIHGTSFPDPSKLQVRGERLATIVLVADGVGGGAAGGQASQLTIETIARYVSHTLRCVQSPGGMPPDEELFASLREAAHQAHDAVRAEAAARGEAHMATTLTLGIGIWPNAYYMQLGDSRAYYYADGKLLRVTRDQTVAQELADQGILPIDRVAKSPFRHVLSRAIGSSEATPEVTRLELKRGCVNLLCSDGLTKHVADAEIAEQIQKMTSSEQLCRTLVDMALDRGGSDNVTVVVARPRDNPT